MTMVSLRFALVPAVLCALAAWVLEGRALAETTYFPIPSASTTRNDGNDAGLIVPILVTDPDGELKYLHAPMIIHNSYLGVRGTYNLFRYDPGGRQTRIQASWTEQIERKLVFSYLDPALSEGRYSFNIGASFFKNATSRFFGLSQETKEQDETNYTAREVRANWKLGAYLNEVTQVAVGQRYREVRIQRGGAKALPYTMETPLRAVNGMLGAAILGHRVTFHYDTRDNLISPTVGTQITAYVELNQNFRNGDNPVYSRTELEIKKLFPSESKKMILMVRGNLQTTHGFEVPFYERSSLGGQNNLRGYGVDRFIDDHLVSLNIEQRINVTRMRVANVMAELEIAPFIDVGKTFNTFKKRQFKDYEATPGIGFRALVRPGTVGRIDYGYSSEGGAVFAGLDYPF
jgi:outer membrane protein assembly factor BamA